MSRKEEFQQIARELGVDFDGEIKAGGNYSPLVRDERRLYVSGQVPRVGNEVVVVGAVGQEVELERAQMAARICVMRALALLERSVGSLDGISRILRITVYVRSAPDFTLQSEVADAASEVLYRVLGEDGVHSRTSIGVLQLPKGATVELDLIASITGDSV